MIERTILSFVAVIMLFLTIEKGDKRSIILASGLTLGILVTWLSAPIVQTMGYSIYILTALLISLNSLTLKSVEAGKRASVAAIGLWVFLIHLSALLQLPNAELTRLSTIIPIVLFGVLLYRGLKKSNEFGYVTILSSELIVSLIPF